MTINRSEQASDLVRQQSHLPGPAGFAPPTHLANLPVAAIGGPHLAWLPPDGRPRWQHRLKRAIDIAVAAIALAALSPLLAAVAIAIRLHDGGPVLFRQRRIGKAGSEFWIIKFRTMGTDAEERLDEFLHQNDATGPLFKLRNDPRVTRLGAMLRRTSIDELPQLWNVIVGDMAIVGPRPALPREIAHWNPLCFDRLSVNAGITGLWQVKGRSDLSWDDGLKYDLEYAANWSILMDLRIMVLTIPRVLLSRGAY